MRGLQHPHDPGRPVVQVFPHAEFQQGQVHQVFPLPHPDALAEGADGLRGVAPAPHPRQGGHAGVIPAADVPLIHQLQELALAHDRIGEVEAGELILAGLKRHRAVVHGPVVQDPVVLVLHGADGMGDALQGVGQGMGVIVHGIDAPGVAGAVMALVLDAVQDRVPQIQVGGGHVDLGPEGPGAVRKLPGPHPLKQVQVLCHGPVAVRAVLPGSVRVPRYSRTSSALKSQT